MQQALNGLALMDAWIHPSWAPGRAGMRPELVPLGAQVDARAHERGYEQALIKHLLHAGLICRVAWAWGWGPLRAGLPANGTPRVSTEPPGELSGRSLSGVSKRLGPRGCGSRAGQKTPAGAFVFPSTTGLRKLLAGSEGCQRPGGGLI